MKIFYLLFILLLMFGLMSVPAGAQDQPVAFKGAKIYPITGDVIENGTLVIHNGKISAIGDSNEVQIPDMAVIIDVSDKIIMPGLVDSHSHLGIYPLPPVEANSDGNEMTGPVQSHLRALDAINPADPGIRSALTGGITTANIMPGSGNVVGGQTAYVKLKGKSIEEMLIHKQGIQGGMKMANGENPKRVYGSKGQSPSTRMAIAALQRTLFMQAREYKAKWDQYNNTSKEEKAGIQPPAYNLELEPIVEVLERKRTVHFHTHRADDIMTILRLKKEFGFDLVLQHVTEGYKVAEEIAKAGASASIITIDSPGGKHEAAKFDLRNGGILEKASVLVAIHTDHPIWDSRLFLRSAALMVREGMSKKGALEALTINPAKMMQLENRIGSLEIGKDADFIVLSGHPFSVKTHVLQTYIDGEPVFDRNLTQDERYATGGYEVSADYPIMEVNP